MALLNLNDLAPSSPSSLHSTTTTKATAAFLISRLLSKPIDLRCGVCFCNPVIMTKTRAITVITTAKALSQIKGAGPDSVSDTDDDDDDDDEENVLFDNLPLDSKLQLKLERKMRMKLANKTIRLRRKKLIHKRRMRKKGRWPPSKLNNLKNV